MLDVISEMDKDDFEQFVQGRLDDLKSRDSFRKKHAIASFTTIKDERAYPMLLDLALDPGEDSYNRASAIDALKRNGDHRCLPRLLPLLDSGEDVICSSIMHLLVRFDHKGTEALVLPFLNRDNLYLRWNAAVALGEVGSAFSVLSLFRVAESFADYQPHDNFDPFRFSCDALGKVIARADMDSLDAGVFIQYLDNRSMMLALRCADLLREMADPSVVAEVLGRLEKGISMELANRLLQVLDATLEACRSFETVSYFADQVGACWGRMVRKGDVSSLAELKHMEKRALEKKNALFGYKDVFRGAHEIASLGRLARDSGRNTGKGNMVLGRVSG